MSYYYPQAAVILKIIFEDFEGNTDTADLKTIHTIQVIARSVTVSVNDYTKADTFNCEIDYKNFPFDPRCIRACGVTICIEDMKSVFKNGSELNTIVPSEDNTVLHGFADEDSINFDDDHRVVRLEGRDFTGLLLDLKAPSEPQPTDQPLDILILNIFKANESLAALKVDNRTGSPLPTLAQFAPNFTPQTAKKNPKPNENYWDLIQEYVSRAALIGYIEIDTFVISKPQVLYGNEQTKQFIYGVNLNSLEFKRKLGRKKGFNIKTISLDLKTKETVQALIPKESTEEWSDSIGIEQEEIMIPQIGSDGSPADPKVAPYMTFRFPDMTKTQLIQTGQKIFEEVGRQQIEGSLTTKELEVIEQGDACFNATDFRVGTPIEILIDQDDLDEISHLKDVNDRVTFLKARCYAPAVAQALAETLGRFHSKFYTKAAHFTVDQESGFKMKLDFVNFIELGNKNLGN